MRQRLIHLVVVAALCWPSVAGAQDAAAAPSTCIAIMLPNIQGMEGDATALGGPVRELMASFLKGPSIQVVLLDARLTAHAFDESRQKSCGHVLTLTLHRRRSGGAGWLGRVAGQAGYTAAWSIPGGSLATAVARGATVAVAHAVSEIASSTKAKDEMRFEYTLTSLDGKPGLGPKSEKGKAKVDGEDLLTPLVQRAAEAIVAKVK
jgi:hypothetical protein